MENEMKVYQFTHKDLDGVGCAVVAGIAFRNCLETTYVNYDDIDAKLSGWLERRLTLPKNSKAMLLISDISPGEDVCIALDDLHRGGEVLVLCVDHHKTSKERLQQFEWARHDERACGTQILHQALQTMPHARESLLAHTELEDFVGAVGAYDLWLLEAPLRDRGETLNRLLWFVGLERFAHEFSESADSDQLSWFLSVAPILREKENAEVESVVGAQSPCIVRTDRDGKKYGVFVAHHNTSQIGNAALRRNPGIDYVAIVNPMYQKFELRSRVGSGVDVGEIAKRLGGGGHLNAAGFPCPLHEFLGELANEKFR